jgi:predicted transcriptional regulator
MMSKGRAKPKRMVDRATWQYGESSKSASNHTGYAILTRTTRTTMADEQQPTSGNRKLTIQIVAAYIRRNLIATDVLPALISTFHEALGRLGTPSESVVERTAAVSIRRSVPRDYVVRLNCGWKGSMLRRHLSTAHALTVAEYRERWNLSAPSYLGLQRRYAGCSFRWH